MQTNRRNFMKTTGAATVGLYIGSLDWSCSKPSRPNILWIIAEDLCPDLGCYGNPFVKTPNIDRLANEGMRHSNAFSTSPVCSPSRSAFMTGMYQTTIDAHQHRSHREDGYRLPPGVKLVTDYFREAGFFTANVTEPAPGIEASGKTDFNFTIENPFDGTDWNQRRPDQPFFAQINFPETHRKFIRSENNPVDAAQIELPPYYPDHPLVREDWAAYYDTIHLLDLKIGAVWERLKTEGLLEKTIIFFFGDNGRPHVRGKQWLYESGIQIPLIIRWPDQSNTGLVSDDLISAIDITATSMKLAGIDPPQIMQGQVFVGPTSQKRNFIIAARDRCDETVDRIRCVRTKQFKYIRNYYPEQAYTQLNRYKEAEYAPLRLMRRLYAQGKLTPEQAKFMASSRPREELYDLIRDPHELTNLAEDTEHHSQLEELRAILDNWIRETGDKGEIPEDPTIAEYYLQKMKTLYDQRIKEYQAANK